MTAKQSRIYRDYAMSHNLKPLMSVGFEFCFRDNAGKEHRATMNTMAQEVLADRAAAKAAKEREKKYASKAPKV